jgi:hypothetical protein
MAIRIEPEHNQKGKTSTRFHRVQQLGSVLFLEIFENKLLLQLRFHPPWAQWGAISTLPQQVATSAALRRPASLSQFLERSRAETAEEVLKVLPGA